MVVKYLAETIVGATEIGQQEGVEKVIAENGLKEGVKFAFEQGIEFALKGIIKSASMPLSLLDFIDSIDFTIRAGFVASQDAAKMIPIDIHANEFQSQP